MYTNSKSRKSNHGYGRGIVMGILLVFVVIACGLTIGARLNSDVEVNPSAVDEAPVATTAEPQVVYVAPVATATPAPAAAPAATPAPVATAQPVEEFPISVLNGNSKLGPYHCEATKSPLSVEPDHVGHIDSLAPWADNGWFVKHDHTVDAIGADQLVYVPVYFADLPNYGDAMMRSEDQGKVGTELARALYGYVLREENGAYNLKVEEYDEDIHVLVGFIFVGEEQSEYWTVWANHQGGYYTLCYVKGAKKPVVETPTWTEPTQPTEPTPTPVDTDPEPVWEDPTTPETPAQPTEEPWDPSFNWDVDPEPVWEEPTTPPSQPETPTQDWDPAFNFEGNTDPEPVWDNTNYDPEPVWESVSAPAAPAEPAVVSDWDSSFNFGSTTEVYTSYAAPVVEAAPVFEAPAVSYDPAPVFESADTGSSSSSASADEGWSSDFNF